jgi:dTDP-4-amino-4,6-dideoxygalactose transaminase
MPVHLFGQVAEMGPILKIAGEHSIRVIEDAAQAIGAEYRGGRSAGAMGDLGCFSFYPSKNLGAMGEAGMVVTSDPVLAEKIRILRAHGAERSYFHRVIGANFRLDAIQAAVLNVKLGYLDGWTAQRQDNAKRYGTLFADCDFARPRLPKAVYETEGLRHYHIFNQYVTRFERRDRLQEHLEALGIGTAVYYPVPLHIQPCFEYLGHREGDFPEAEQAAKEVLALPIYAELTGEQQSTIVEAVEDFYIS